MKPPNTAIFALTAILCFPVVWCQATRAPYDLCGDSVLCGGTPLEYPFWGSGRPAFCGLRGFELTCETNVLLLRNESLEYRVLLLDGPTHTITVARNDLWSDKCPRYLYNTTYDTTIFDRGNFDQEDISLYYGCGPNFAAPFGNSYKFDCDTNDTTTDSYFANTNRIVDGVVNSFVQCNNHITVPVNRTSADRFALGAATTEDLTSALRAGFNLRWTANNDDCDLCTRSGGRCGSNGTSPALFACYCASGNFSLTCNNARFAVSGGSKKNKSLTTVLPIIGAILAVIAIGFVIFICRRRRKRRAIEAAAAAAAQTNSKTILTTDSSKGLTSTTQSNFSSSIPSYPSSKTSKDYTKSSYFGTQVFTYEELEVATDNFNGSRELGDGGFGTVYYGKLLDGREVAVKRLYENNFKRVEQFMNEVEILTRLNHDNLVKLYGCTSKRSRELLLVYEYIPNGTVADHLHGKLANSTSGLSTWSVRLNIAVETADALAYLHKSDIIHRDVKTNNILLDKNFQVKVADFGLSRLFPNDATHVSTAPQGTPGYVDPEYYQCYQLTDKSDVYSFGVVLIELVSSLQAVDTSRDRLDINLATLAMNKIQNHNLDELVDKGIGFETSGVVRRMTTLVAELAFRCLQQERDMRPTMKEVLEVLRGIQNEELNAQRQEVVEIVVEDGGLLKDQMTEPPSPDSGATERLVGGSVPNSSNG